MTVSADMLNTQLSDLKGPIEHTATQAVPFYDRIVKGGAVADTVKGNYIERTIMGGSPAQGVGIITGTEPIPMSNVDKTQKIRVEPHRIVVALPITKQKMIATSGTAGAMGLIKESLKAVVDLYPVDFESYLLNGVSTGHVFSTTALSGWNTLAGDKTMASGRVGVTHGLLEMDTEALQNGTIQDLLAAQAYGYVNQYGVVTTWASDGRKICRRVTRDCARWNMSKDETTDEIWMDADSYELYEEEQESKVIMQVNKQLGDGSSNLYEVKAGLGAKNVRCSKILDRTQFTGLAASGIAYALNYKGFEWHWQQKPTTTDFVDLGPQYDMVAAKIEMQGSLVLRGRRMQGVIVGCAR